jgi:hypothetical protein
MGCQIYNRQTNFLSNPTILITPQQSIHSYGFAWQAFQKDTGVFER